MTPGVRIVAIASSAIAEVSLRSFLIGLLIGNGVFLTGHFVLGLFLGEPAVRLVASAGTGLIVAGVALAAIGAAGWLLIGRRRSRARAARAEPSPASSETALDWTDACCPACLALAVLAPSVRTGDAG